MLDLVFLLAAAFAFVVLEMTLTFVVAQRLRNFGIVDIVWSAGFSGLALLFFAVSARLRGNPGSLRDDVLTIMVLVWSLRLASHLWVRVMSHHPVEDVRYARLREEWGERTPQKMFGFFQLQGVLQVVLSLPFLVVCLNPHPPGPGPLGLRWAEWAGLTLWIIALMGESIADRQLARFRRDPANRGQVCQVGLWYWSRHPNYFFEWLIWVAFALFAWNSPFGWIGLLSPLLMWHFLVNVTGIPMTEELSVKSKGDAYREYQRTTSAFFPWFKKSLPAP